jgi:hypothetical protein
MRKVEWAVSAKRPFAGPAAVLAYPARYTHRVPIANSRLAALDERGVTFCWKDYCATGKTRHKTMTLSPDEIMCRFLLHVLPSGFHRIPHYGLIANGECNGSLVKARALLKVAAGDSTPEPSTQATAESVAPTFVCPYCGAPMRIIETLARGQPIRAPPRYQAKP